MADLPIPFTPAMVRRIIAEIEQPGTGKTQTRRLMKPADCEKLVGGVRPTPKGAVVPHSGSLFLGLGPYHPPRYAVGDRLWVREAWKAEARFDDCSPLRMPLTAPIYYTAGGGGEEVIPDCAGRGRPGMFMMRWMSRITLVVTEVRVQRLNEITEADALAEGIYRQDPTPEEIAAGECTADDYVFIVPGVPQRWGRTKAEREREIWWPDAAGAFLKLWASINGEVSVQVNPWVAAYSFRPVLSNIDDCASAATAAPSAPPHPEEQPAVARLRSRRNDA